MGAKSSPGGTTQSTQNVNTGPWSTQAPYLQQGFQEAQSNYGTAKNNQYYGGQTVAPIVPGAQTALDTTMSMGNTVDPNVKAAATNNLNTVNGTYLDPNSNPYLKDTFNAAADAVTRQYQTGTSPQTDGSFESAGRYGSGSRQNAVTGNQLAYGTTLNNLATNIYGGNYQNERTNQMNAVNAAPALNSAQYINPSAAIGAGQTVQQTNQNQDTSNMNAYNYNRDQPTNALNNYMAQIQGNYGTNGTTQTSTQQPNTYSNPLSSIMGGLFGLGSLAVPGAGGVSALRNIFSDRRLKTDIFPIGETYDGQTIYRYRYVGSTQMQIGLMAEEVRNTTPEAVGERHGYLTVDYEKATDRAVRIAEQVV